MRLAIVGCRNFTDYREFVSETHRFDFCEIVSGGCRGTDKLAERYALEYGIPIVIFHPDWNKYGKAAGPIRNRQIVEYCDAVLAFWDGRSAGTKSTIVMARKAGKPIEIIDI